MNSSPYSLLITVSLCGYLASSVLYPMEVFARKHGATAWRRWILLVSAALHLLGLILFRHYAGHSLFSGADGTALFFAWSVVVGLIFFERRASRTVLGVFAMPVVFFVGLYALGCPVAARQPSSPLHTYWLFAHVAITIVGYVFFTIAFFYAVLYLTTDRLLKSKRTTGLFRLLPSLKTSDAVTCYLTATGLCLLTIGILTGVIQAHIQVPDYHPWQDRKIVLSFVLWCFYAACLLSRRLLGWRGRKAGICSLVGFHLLLLTLFSQHGIIRSLPK